MAIRFDIYKNNMENSIRHYRFHEDAKEINNGIFEIVNGIFEQGIEDSMSASNWAELATENEDWVNDDITIVCHVED